MTHRHLSGCQYKEVLSVHQHISFFSSIWRTFPCQGGCLCDLLSKVCREKKKRLFVKSLCVFALADTGCCHISISNDFMHKWNAENTLCTQIIQWNPILMGSQIWYQPYSAVQLRRLEGITSFWRNQLARWVIFLHIRIARLPA